jgi:hypothetical protein
MAFFMHKIIEWNLPIQTVSEANRGGEHWSKKHKRHKHQHTLIWLAFRNIKEVPLPCHVKMTRISPRMLDADDNLPMSFKYIKDKIASEITGIKQVGKADSDERITWEYSQEKGKPQSVRIEIFH